MFVTEPMRSSLTLSVENFPTEIISFVANVFKMSNYFREIRLRLLIFFLLLQSIECV